MSIADVRYLQVSGHTDRIGKVDYNRQLSEKRAEAVRDYPVAKGVSAEKIEVFGFGQTMPIRSCADSSRLRRADLIECLAPNRRVVMEIQGRQQGPIFRRKIEREDPAGGTLAFTSPRRTCRRRTSSACGCSRAAIRRNRA